MLSPPRRTPLPWELWGPFWCPNPVSCPSPSPLPQLCGARAPCRAAEEFLQSLLGSIGSHVLSLRHPGSARFLLGPEGQHLLRELEARFQCVFGTERLAREALDTDPTEVESLPLPFLTPPPGTASPAQRLGRGVSLR